MDAIEDESQAGTTFPLCVVCKVPCFQGCETVTWSDPCMSTEAGSCKGAQNEFVGWETQMFWNVFCIAEQYVLLDSTCIPLNS